MVSKVNVYFNTMHMRGAPRSTDGEHLVLCANCLVDVMEAGTQTIFDHAGSEGMVCEYCDAANEEEPRPMTVVYFQHTTVRTEITLTRWPNETEDAFTARTLAVLRERGRDDWSLSDSFDSTSYHDYAIKEHNVEQS